MLQLLLLSVMLATAEGQVDFTCVEGMQFHGVLDPREDTEVEVGSDPFYLTCLLDPQSSLHAQGYRAESMYFSVQAKYKTSLQVSIEAEVLNSTAIRGVFDPWMADELTVTCNMNTSSILQSAVGICKRTIFVGYPPLMVEDFLCLSDNWENINCTWTVPFNPIRTTYNVFFKGEGRYIPFHGCCIFGKSKANEDFEFCSLNSRKIHRLEPEFYLGWTDRMYMNQEEVDIHAVDFYSNTDQQNTTTIRQIKRDKDPSFPSCEANALPCDCNPDPLSAGAQEKREIVLYAFDPLFFNFTHFSEVTGNTPIWEDFLSLLAQEDGVRKTWTITTTIQVRPGPVIGLEARSVTSSSISVVYQVPANLRVFPVNLVHELRYRSMYDFGVWRYLPLINRTKAKEEGLSLEQTDKWHSIELEDLIPHTKYTFAVRLLSGTANPTQEVYWGEFSSNATSTKPRIPSRSPKVDPASFEGFEASSTQSRKLYIYWQSLEAWEENGPNFTYRVETIITKGGEEVKIVADEVTPAYAVFRDMPLSELRFRIRSENSLGGALDAATVVVPASKKLDNIQPLDFFKTFVKQSGVYELTWRRPRNFADIQNYTIFMCQNNRERPHLCTGNLTWQSIPVTNGSEEKYFVQLKDLNPDLIYQLAIAANLRTYSSGLKWTECSFIKGESSLEKIKDVRITEIFASAMKIEWSTDCNNKVGGVDVFEIQVCEQNSTNPCIQPITKVGYDRESHLIENLEPYTNYSVELRVVTLDGLRGQLSEPRVNQTLPAPPKGPPLNVNITSANPNATRATWSQPEITNGPIIMYWVKVDMKNETVLNYTTGEDPQFSSPLQAYSNYSLKVCGCTTSLYDSCGPWSNKTHFRTDIGVPEAPSMPTIHFSNTTYVTVSWDQNFKLNAPRPYEWEVKVWRAEEVWQDAEKIKEKEVNGSKTSLGLDLEKIQTSSGWSPQCDNSSLTNLFNFSIRVIVLNEKKVNLTSPWSAVVTVPAYCESGFPWVYILLVTGVVVVAAVSLTLSACSVTAWIEQKRDIFEKIGAELDYRFEGRADVLQPDVPPIYQEERTDLLPGVSLAKKVVQNRDQSGLASKAKLHHGLWRSETTSGCESGRSVEDTGDQKTSTDQEIFRDQEALKNLENSEIQDTGVREMAQRNPSSEAYTQMPLSPTTTNKGYSVITAGPAGLEHGSGPNVHLDSTQETSDNAYVHISPSHILIQPSNLPSAPVQPISTYLQYDSTKPESHYVPQDILNRTGLPEGGSFVQSDGYIRHMPPKCTVMARPGPLQVLQGGYVTFNSVKQLSSAQSPSFEEERLKGVCLDALEEDKLEGAELIPLTPGYSSVQTSIPLASGYSSVQASTPLTSGYVSDQPSTLEERLKGVFLDNQEGDKLEEAKFTSLAQGYSSVQTSTPLTPGYSSIKTSTPLTSGYVFIQPTDTLTPGDSFTQPATPMAPGDSFIQPSNSLAPEYVSIPPSNPLAPGYVPIQSTTPLTPGDLFIQPTSLMTPGYVSIHPTSTLTPGNKSIQPSTPLTPGNKSIQPSSPLAPENKSIPPSSPLAPGYKSIPPSSPLTPGYVSIQATTPLTPGGSSVQPSAPLTPGYKSVQPTTPLAPGDSFIQPITPLAPGYVSIQATTPLDPGDSFIHHPTTPMDPVYSSVQPTTDSHINSSALPFSLEKSRTEGYSQLRPGVRPVLCDKQLVGNTQLFGGQPGGEGIPETKGYVSLCSQPPFRNGTEINDEDINDIADVIVPFDISNSAAYTRISPIAESQPSTSSSQLAELT